MSAALLLTASDLRPLRDEPAHMRGALDAVQSAIVAHHQGAVRQGRLVDRRPGEFEGIRLSLLAGDGLLSGMRVFGNPPHTRAFLLFEGETRALLALMDYGVLNSLRVGATAGVAARHLAPAGARSVGLLGSGWQAAPQVGALLAAVPSIQEIRVFSPTRAHREAFARDMTLRHDLPVIAVDSAEEAIRAADIVDLCAPGHFDERTPLLTEDWVQPGALVISMAPSQYPAELAAQARLVADIPEFTSDASVPVGGVIVDKVPPRRSDDERVIYRLEGGTVQDLFVATWGYTWARDRGLGQAFDLSA
ncbi:MAG: ornithine cyclodeaminase family protein [Chloroflexi bacterium]|nr:ornithine cyclodeaminase family protein [Chloroflexota bacterium]